MKGFTVDASVAVKWFVPEVHSEQAVKLLENNYELIVPDLIYSEFSNIIWKKHRIKELNETIANEIIIAFEQFIFEKIVTSQIMQGAFDIAVKYDRSVYDCMYLMAACTTDTKFVTADKKFFNAINSTPLSNNILWVENL